MPVATPKYRWHQEHSVHIAALDRQHQNLLDTMNELDAALRTGETKASIESIMDKLVQYAIMHFADEEEVMEKHGFPGLAEHRTAHSMFRRTMAGFVVDYKAGQLDVPGEMLSFMDNWLLKHLQEMDQKYAEYLKLRSDC